MRKLILTLALLTGAAYAADGSRENAFRRNLAEGAAFLKEGSKSTQARALGRFREALKLKPDSAEAYYWISLTFYDYENYNLAASNAEKATFLDPELGDAWLLWGQCLMCLGKWEDAKEKLEKAHRLAPNNPLAAFNLARCYYHGFGNSQVALNLFRKVIDLSRSGNLPWLEDLATQARVYIGCCYLSKDMPEAAIVSFKDALHYSPTHLEARFRLGLAYRRAGRFEEAEKMWRAVLAAEPAHFETYLQLGHMYIADLPDADLSALHLKRFLQFAPENHPWRERVKKYLDGQGKKEG
jgi:tetratricopeptide (TPR) repeat protein